MTHADALAAAIRRRLVAGQPAPLPGLGTLVRQHVSARVETRPDGSRVLIPPGETVGLAPSNTAAEGLAPTFASVQGLPAEQAEHAFAEAMDQVEARLAATGEVRLPGVGLLRRTSSGVVLGVEEGLLADVNQPFDGLLPVPAPPVGPARSAPSADAAPVETQEDAPPEEAPPEEEALPEEEDSPDEEPLPEAAPAGEAEAEALPGASFAPAFVDSDDDLPTPEALPAAPDEHSVSPDAPPPDEAMPSSDDAVEPDTDEREPDASPDAWVGYESEDEPSVGQVREADEGLAVPFGVDTDSLDDLLPPTPPADDPTLGTDDEFSEPVNPPEPSSPVPEDDVLVSSAGAVEPEPVDLLPPEADPTDAEDPENASAEFPPPIGTDEGGAEASVPTDGAGSRGVDYVYGVPVERVDPLDGPEVPEPPEPPPAVTPKPFESGRDERPAEAAPAPEPVPPRTEEPVGPPPTAGRPWWTWALGLVLLAFIGLLVWVLWSRAQADAPATGDALEPSPIVAADPPPLTQDTRPTPEATESAEATPDGPSSAADAPAEPAAGDAAPAQRSEATRSAEAVLPPRVVGLPDEDVRALSGSPLDAGADAWTLVVFSSPLESEAEAQAVRYREAGYRTGVVEARVAGRTWYRTAVGQFTSEADANRLRDRLPPQAPSGTWALDLRTL